jgi:RHS repeat-associated protein
MRVDGVTGDSLSLTRELDPTLGTWMSEDPTGLGPDVNWYRFVENNPIDLVDPTGLMGSGPAPFDYGTFAVNTVQSLQEHYGTGLNSSTLHFLPGPHLNDSMLDEKGNTIQTNSWEVVTNMNEPILFILNKSYGNWTNCYAITFGISKTPDGKAFLALPDPDYVKTILASQWKPIERDAAPLDIVVWYNSNGKIEHAATLFQANRQDGKLLGDAILVSKNGFQEDTGVYTLDKLVAKYPGANWKVFTRNYTYAQ